jgi:hypothetical protein
MRRRSFLGGLFAAPAVITTPGLLMPVSTLALPTHGPKGIITPEMIAREFNRRLQAMVGTGFVSSDAIQQGTVDLKIPPKQLMLSMEQFSGRYIAPAAEMIASTVNKRGGTLAIGAELSVPHGIDNYAFSDRNGIQTRVLSVYSIGYDAQMLCFDVRHS